MKFIAALLGIVHVFALAFFGDMSAGRWGKQTVIVIVLFVIIIACNLFAISLIREDENAQI